MFLAQRKAYTKVKSLMRKQNTPSSGQISISNISKTN